MLVGVAAAMKLLAARLTTRKYRIERVDEGKARMMERLETAYGMVEANPTQLELGELLVTDEGVEMEVVSLGPLRLEPAPEEEEDWGE